MGPLVEASGFATYMCIYLSIYIYLYLYVYLYYIETCTCMHVYMQICRNSFIYICMYACIEIMAGRSWGLEVYAVGLTYGIL